MLIIHIIVLYHLAFGVFHLFFWKLLKWNEQLGRVSSTNRAVVQTLNICLTFMFFLIAYVCYFHAEEVLTSGLGRTLLIGMGAFWLIRAILQIYLFNMKQRIHQLLFVMFIIGIALHVAALFEWMRSSGELY